jgi:AcrR family transcriptional regulator
VTPAAPDRDEGATPRGAETRARILEAALALFRERGYDATTMRAVAERSGTSLGNAYYYFESKEHLLQGYYARSHEEHERSARPVLERERTLEDRLRGVLLGRLEADEPYHRFAGLLFRTAADPASPLNPFAPAAAPVRERSVALFREVVDGSRLRAPRDLRARLPELLWLFQMGIVLFWIHDASPGRARTRTLIEHGSAIVVRLITLASNPLVSPLRRRTLRLLDDLLPPGALFARPAGER